MLFFILSAFLLASAGKCGKAKNPADCYKGRLEKKGICMNYTISVIEGSIDTSMVENSWTDPNTGTRYARAFRLGSVCSFPQTINEGDEFYFTIDKNPEKDCAVCQAYYPTPSKTIFIRVLNEACR